LDKWLYVVLLKLCKITEKEKVQGICSTTALEGDICHADYPFAICARYMLLKWKRTASAM